MLITEKQLAKRWVMSPATLRKWRIEGRSIEFIKLPNGGIRFDLSIIEAAEENGRSRSTSDGEQRQ